MSGKRVLLVFGGAELRSSSTGLAYEGTLPFADRDRHRAAKEKKEGPLFGAQGQSSSTWDNGKKKIPGCFQD